MYCIKWVGVDVVVDNVEGVDVKFELKLLSG